MTSFTQQTFLGASIRNFSASIGWGSQPSTLRCSVVEDPDNGDSFSPPLVGQPRFFNYQGWKFGGLLQSWVERKDSQANPVYDIVLEDPRRILEGVQLILQDYNGGTYGINNLYNIYGYLESTYGFGGSLSNDSGIPWYLIRDAFYQLQLTTPIIYRGFAYHAPIFVGLSLLPNYYRVPGDSISALDFIQHVCDVASMDFFITLLGGGQITVNLINRKTAPTFGLIDYYINESGGNIVSKTIGRELRNETVSKFVVGGKVSSMYYQANSSGSEDTRTDDTIWPYWGHDVYGNLIIGEGEFEGANGGYHKFTLDGTELYLETGDPYFVFYKTNVDELRHALAGQASWMSYLWWWNDRDFFDTAETRPNIHKGKAERIGLGDGNNSSMFNFLKSESKEKLLKTRDYSFGPLSNSQLGYAYAKHQEQKVAKIYQFIYKYASEYYGKKFMVRIPFVLARQLDGTYKTELSVEPTDAGFVDESYWPGLYVNGYLPYNTNKLTKPDGRILPFARFDGVMASGVLTDNDNETVGAISRFSINQISPEDYTLDQYPGKSKGEVRERLFVKCSQEEKLVFLNYNTLASPRMVVTLPDSVKDNTVRHTYNSWFINEIFDLLVSDERTDPLTSGEALALTNRIASSFGSEHMWMAKDAGIMMPDMVALAMQSNILTYGPWYATSKDGKVEYEHDESLVPWNYGSYTSMNYAGLAKVEDAMSGQQAAEKGHLEFEGPPELTLGSELVAGGPTVTDIDVNIGEEGATTTYRMNTWTWQFGKLTKYDANRFKDFAKLAQEQRRAFRQIFRQNLTLDSRITLARALNVDRQNKGESSSKVIAADMIYTATNGDPVVSTNIALMAPYRLGPQISQDDYHNKAGMSLEGLLRPCTTNPESETGHFPHFENPNIGADTPNVNNLNPFNGTTDIGIAFPDQSGIPNNLSNEISDYTGHSKIIGLRMPLIGVGWGYDTDGNPVPSGGDGEFLTGYKTRMDQWKAGPVDMRWDDSKKVWVATGGTSSSSKLGVLNSNLFPSGTANVTVWEYDDDKEYPQATQNTEEAIDWLLKPGTILYTGTKVVITQVDDEWYVTAAVCQC